MASGNMNDLLGEPSVTERDPWACVDAHLKAPTMVTPGKTFDLSGGAAPASSSYASGYSSSSGDKYSSSSAPSYAPGSMSSGFGSKDRGPSSIEGGGGGLSLSALNPQAIMRQLATKPLTEVVTENGRQILNLPKVAARAYSAAARKYLQPWNEFMRMRPGRIVEGLRGAQRRGEIQVHLQRNVLANARHFCPNYAFVFLAMLFMFVCTSPGLLCMLGAVGGGWSHAMRSDSFRNRPWNLQIGGVSVPLGSNMKMLLMSLPTLLFLHFFMGPVLWSAALYSGGMSAVHAALRDRDDDVDPNDHGLGGDREGV
eukprot:TRINITY_DN75392_c0_g1_i1.p1 TRINITY_DN75392_c0_g1~~TRINITY_DN75392_c0_g1_i1.p1  ORF type:complete len:312 (+),score=81.22 TRINITY_DN75392_c0_g1_i1:87-1022(+)